MWATLGKKRRLINWLGIFFLVGYLLFDHAMAVTGNTNWQWSSDRENRMAMEKTFRGLNTYHNTYKQLPPQLDGLYYTRLLNKSGLYDWTDREAGSSILMEVDYVNTRLFSRHARLLYFVPADRKNWGQISDDFIILAEPYSLKGERYVYRIKNLTNEPGGLLPHPEKLKEEEFRQQLGKQNSVITIYREKDDLRPEQPTGEMQQQYLKQFEPKANMVPAPAAK